MYRIFSINNTGTNLITIKTKWIPIINRTSNITNKCECNKSRNLNYWIWTNLAMDIKVTNKVMKNGVQCNHLKT